MGKSTVHTQNKSLVNMGEQKISSDWYVKTDGLYTVLSRRLPNKCTFYFNDESASHLCTNIWDLLRFTLQLKLNWYLYTFISGWTAKSIISGNEVWLGGVHCGIIKQLSALLGNRSYWTMWIQNVKDVLSKGELGWFILMLVWVLKKTILCLCNQEAGLRKA